MFITSSPSPWHEASGTQLPCLDRFMVNHSYQYTKPQNRFVAWQDQRTKAYVQALRFPLAAGKLSVFFCMIRNPPPFWTSRFKTY